MVPGEEVRAGWELVKALGRGSGMPGAQVYLSLVEMEQSGLKAQDQS